MNKQSYPEYLFKHLRRNSKRILSIMLAFAILTENPLSAYASTKATPSNIPESSASIESTDTNIDIDTDFGVEDFETNPDQDPDHGPGIDSTTPTYPYYRPVVDTSTIPDEVEMDNDNLDAILGAGANCIDDFDPDDLVPLSPEAVEFIENYTQDSSSNINTINSYQNEISTHVVSETIAVGALALLVIYFALKSSAYRSSGAEYPYSQIKKCANNDSFSATFNYVKNGIVEKATITQIMMKNLLEKLDSASNGDGYSMSFTEDDKVTLAYSLATYSPYNVTSINPKSVNVRAVDGYKYYYIYGCSKSFDYKQDNCGVLYSSSPIAYATISKSMSPCFRFFRANAALKEYGYEEMDVYDSSYSLSNNTRLYEFKSGQVATSGNFTKPYYYNYIGASFPFLIVPEANYSTFKDCIVNSPITMLDVANNGKMMLLDDILSLDSVSSKGKIDGYLDSKKNYTGAVTGLNSGAGTVTGTTTDSGSTTKPGTGTDTGTGGGTTTTPDYSGPLSNILGTLGTILAAVNGIPNILSLFQLLPTTIKGSIVEALKSIPFFESALLYLSLISTGVQNILDWDIEAWIDGVNTDLGNAIDNLGTDVLQKLANLPNIDNLGGIIGAALAGSVPLTRMADAVVNIADKLKTWNIDNYGEEFIKALETAMAALGLGSLLGTLGALKDLTGAKLDDVLAKLQELTASLSGLKLGIDLDSLSETLKELLTALGLGSLLGAVTNIGSMLETFSFADLMNLIKALPASIVAAITEALPNWKTPEIEENENDSGFHNFLNLFMIGLLIIILLMILFINCLRFIVLVFNVPASSALIHADMLRGIEYMKNLQIPVFGVSLYALLLSCAYFVIFMTVIAAIRRKIDKMHI